MQCDFIPNNSEAFLLDHEFRSQHKAAVFELCRKLKIVEKGDAFCLDSAVGGAVVLDSGRGSQTRVIHHFVVTLGKSGTSVLHPPEKNPLPLSK